MHTLKLKLKVNNKQRDYLNKCFYLSYLSYVETSKYAQKQLRLLSKNREYKYLKHLYGLNINDKKKLKEITNKLNTIIKSYEISKGDLEKYIALKQHKYKAYLTSMQGQKIADELANKVKKVLFSNRKNIHIKKYREFCNISQKDTNSGVKFYGDYIKFFDMTIPVIYSKNKKDLNYILESMDNDLSYCELERLEFNSGYEYYVKLVLKGDAPSKHEYGNNEGGIDPGVSTMAYVSEEKCILEELAPKCKDYDKKIRELQKRIDKSLRDTNPNAFNEDGTYKKGSKLIYTKHCKELKRRVRVLYRQKSAYTKCSHNNLINRMLNGVNKINIEDMDYKALAKRIKETKRQEKVSIVDGKEIKKFKKKGRFGKSINDRSPGYFVKLLEEKCNRYNIEFNKINTKKIKASKYNHLTDNYEDHKLNERTKYIGKDKVQRDLYSAYIIKNVLNDLETLNKEKLNNDFSKFLEMQEVCIEDIKQKGIKNKNFGF